MELSLYQNIFNSIQESLKTDEAAKASKDFHPDDISDLKSAIDVSAAKNGKNYHQSFCLKERAVVFVVISF